MALNWNPFSILLLISGILIFISTLAIFIKSTTRKIHSLRYVKIALMILAISIFLDGIGFLFVDTTLSKIAALLVIPTALCFSIGINYTLRETYHSIHLIIISCLGVLICYLAFQSGTIETIIEYGYLSNIYIGLFRILSDILTVIMAIIIFYWGFITWKNAPFIIKKEANIFFIGIVFSTIIPAITILIGIEYHLISNIICYTSLNIGIAIFVYAIIKEPKLLYILPFIVNRILVKDKEGYPLFAYDWSESDISEFTFTCFINAVQIMSEEVMNKGGLIDIDLEEGRLILHESTLITVGLFTSKSSQLLKDALVNFSRDFEQQFIRQLKRKIRDPFEYESAYLLIDKYFSNFPFRLIKSKKQPLLLTGKSEKVPFELENKLEKIFPNEKEYESIITEIAKSPAGLSEEFLNLYEDLKQEMD